MATSRRLDADAAELSQGLQPAFAGCSPPHLDAATPQRRVDKHHCAGAAVRQQLLRVFIVRTLFAVAGVPGGELPVPAAAAEPRRTVWVCTSAQRRHPIAEIVSCAAEFRTVY